jgi:RNA recognition motif-containing protein
MRVFVGGLNDSLTENDLKVRFSAFGRVDKVEMVRKPLATFAFVDLSCSAEKFNNGEL